MSPFAFPVLSDLTLLDARSFQNDEGIIWKIALCFKDVKQDLIFEASYQYNGINSLYVSNGNSRVFYPVSSDNKHSTRNSFTDVTPSKITLLLESIRMTFPSCFSALKPSLTNIKHVENQHELIHDYLLKNALFNVSLRILTCEDVNIVGMRKPSYAFTARFFISEKNEVCITASGRAKTGTPIKKIRFLNIN